MRHLCLCLALPAAAQPVRLTFAPPDGTHYVEVFVQTTTTEYGGRVGRTEVMATTREVHFRTTPEGYIVAATPLETRRTRNGSPAGLGQAGRLVEAAVTYHISSQGGFLDVTGYEAAIGQLAARGVRVNRDALANLARARWDADFGDLVGLAVSPEEIWRGAGRYRVKGRLALSYAIYTRITERRSAGPARVVIASRFVPPRHGASPDGRVQGRALRTVDPRTLLPYGSREEMRISLRTHIISPSPVTITERRETTYLYP